MSFIELFIVYLIIHLLAVLHIFNLFDKFNYKPDEIEKLLIWMLAPEIVLSIVLIVFFRKGR